jgi:glycosyltransferase involved in cell wall biosynthesis
MDAKNIWISWELQRRSIELSKILDCEFHVFQHKGVFRYPVCIFNTVKVLYKNSGNIIFVQNPSMILSAIACFLKGIFDYTLVVDRHSTFPLKNKKLTPSRILYLFLNKYTIANADLTIVTNKFLADLVNRMNGNSFILPDMLPSFIKTKKVKLKNGFNILMISSFGKDEPILQVIKSAINIKSLGVNLYVTGNFDKLDSDIRQKAPDNVIFTGFLDDIDFINHLYSVDAVMALTTANYCMLCGCYEAVTAEKPLITSDKKVLTEYFKGSIFVDNSPKGIHSGIKRVINNYAYYKKNAIDLKETINSNWINIFNELKFKLKSMR